MGSTHSLSLLPPVDVKDSGVEDVHQPQVLLRVQTSLQQGHGGRILLQAPARGTGINFRIKTLRRVQGTMIHLFELFLESN